MKTAARKNTATGWSTLWCRRLKFSAYSVHATARVAPCRTCRRSSKSCSWKLRIAPSSLKLRPINESANCLRDWPSIFASDWQLKHDGGPPIIRRSSLHQTSTVFEMAFKRSDGCRLVGCATSPLDRGACDEVAGRVRRGARARGPIGQTRCRPAGSAAGPEQSMRG